MLCSFKFTLQIVITNESLSVIILMIMLTVGIIYWAFIVLQALGFIYALPHFSLSTVLGQILLLSPFCVWRKGNRHRTVKWHTQGYIKQMYKTVIFVVNVESWWFFPLVALCLLGCFILEASMVDSTAVWYLYHQLVSDHYQTCLFNFIINDCILNKWDE